MNHAQRLLIIVLLIFIGALLAFVFLDFGEGAFSNLAGNRIAILVLREGDKNSFIGSGYGLYTTFGIAGILLGLVTPICLFAVATFISLGASRR